jgi:FdhE protein
VSGFGDLPTQAIGQPDAIILPDPATLFRRRAERLRVLAVGHPMGDWLRFLALVADAQGTVRVGVEGRPRLDGQATEPDATYEAALSAIATIACGPGLPDAARDVLAGLPALDTIALGAAWLAGTLPPNRAGEAVFVAAALQVQFVHRAATLDAAALELLPQRGLCPVCRSAPVGGVVTASGKTPGVRYLHCGLCATAWNYVRAACTGCGESKGIALREVEGGTGAVKAETCDACRGYAKMFYQAKDMAIEPFADDLGSLGLDLMVSDAGWSRLAPNPFVLG